MQARLGSDATGRRHLGSFRVSRRIGNFLAVVTSRWRAIQCPRPRPRSSSAGPVGLRPGAVNVWRELEDARAAWTARIGVAHGNLRQRQPRDGARSGWFARPPTWQLWRQPCVASRCSEVALCRQWRQCISCAHDDAATPRWRKKHSCVPPEGFPPTPSGPSHVRTDCRQPALLRREPDPPLPVGNRRGARPRRRQLARHRCSTSSDDDRLRQLAGAGRAV
jgi:hypothetical protein